MIYPGPASIAAGKCPDGLVVHGYSVPDEVLLFVSTLTDDDTADAQAERDMLRAADWPEVCLVFYDGDTGDRMRFPPGGI